MARIVYGVMGDSLGHVLRSKAMADTLPRHEFLFIGGGTVPVLERAGYRVAYVPVLGTAIGPDRVRLRATVSSALKLFPALSREIGRVARMMEKFQPDLVVTDYEFFSQWAARKVGLPCISIDSHHMLTLCNYELPPGHHVSRLMTLTLMRFLFSAASSYLVTTFHAAQPKDPRMTEVLPPILRAEVERHRPSQGEHGVVYLRGGLPKGIAQALARMSRPYIVYGLGAKPPEGNLSFKPFSESEFLSDLASSAYYICNGGHTALSEALFYGKPVLCRPVDLFYEQTVNCFLLSSAGYGEWVTRSEDWAHALMKFENGIERYTERIKGKVIKGNDLAASRVERLIHGGEARPHR